MKNSDNPLVSLCITCYNQAKYIRGAMQSAFNQTYSPLEIIVCDDCSTDGTDKIIEEMVAEYKGPHKVVFKRNEHNLNVVKNYEQAFKTAHGELLVTGAGDDVSMPNRVAVIVQAWLSANCAPTVIHHARFDIDEKGRCIGWADARESYFPLGACSAYRRDVFEIFPEVDEVGAYEDMVFCARACLIGETLRLQDRLVCYRYGGTTASHVNRYDLCVRGSQRELVSQRQMAKDIAFARGKLEDKRIAEVEDANLRRKHEAEERLRFFTGGTFRIRLGVAKEQHLPKRGWGFWATTVFVLPRLMATILSNAYMRWHRFKAVYVNTYRDPPKEYLQMKDLCLAR